MKSKEFLEEQNKKNDKYPREARVIPTSEVMRKFKEIYQKHKKVFDYLKDR